MMMYICCMEKLLQLLSGKKYHIDEQWALSQLSETLIKNELGVNSFKEELQKSKSIDIYLDGNLQGDMEQLDYVPGGSIAKINFSGVMTENDGWCNIGMATLAKQLEQLYSTPQIKGILLSMSTGGGESTAGDVLLNAIADRNKPVVVYTTFLASAGIKGTLPADEIIAASPSTEVGSIGVMITLSKKYLEYIKQNELSLYSTKSPNKNQEFRQALEDNFDPLIERLTTIDEIFMNQVQQYRTLRGNIEDTLSGSVITATEAVDRGLIDSIGTLQFALTRLQSHIKYYKA